MAQKKQAIKRQAIFTQILKQYGIPDAERKLLQKRINVFIRQLQTALKKNNIQATVMLGGSAAKSTYIKDDFDCDIFVRFNYKKYSAEEQKIASSLAKVLRKQHPAVIHGSRDYFHVLADDIRYEIVPVLDVQNPEKAANVTDMSPLHVAWIMQHMTPKLRNEIILTKLFLKAQQLYGAESYIKGFSGHVVDILLVFYGSLLRLLQASQKWKQYEVIDVAKHNTAKWLNKSKISPLIVIDPVQPNRNAAAALSLEKFHLFQRKAADFLKTPSLQYFVKNSMSSSQLQQQLKRKFPKYAIFIIELFPAAGKEDIMLTKLLKAFEYIRQQAEENDFDLSNAAIDFSDKKKVLAYFVVPKKPLETQRVIKGPAVEFTKGCEEFQKKHATAFLKGKRWYAYQQRSFTRLSDFLNSMKQEGYVKQRAKEIKIITTND